MKLDWFTQQLHTRHPFVIARGGYPAHITIVVNITASDGTVGTGEGAPNRFYGETIDTATAALSRLSPIIERADGWSLEAVEREMDLALSGNAGAKSAISAALHDLQGKRLGAPLYRVLGLDPAACPQSSFTIAIASDEEIRQRLQEALEYPILKVKLGTDRDEAIVRLVRDLAPAKRLRVDANAAWNAKHAVRMSAFLADHGVEMLEQPVASTDIEGLRFVRQRSSIPIVADESCVRATDIVRLAGAVDAINIKLAKCGGLREAFRMVHVARAHDLRVMAGCMIESSLGITAIAQLASLLDFADFDGAALLSSDPYVGATIRGGNVVLPAGAGLGVSRVANAA